MTPAVLARVPTDDERAETLLSGQRRADRDRWRDLMIASASCLAWMLVGLVLLGWSMHTTDPGWGAIAFWGGLVVGNAGILGTIYWLYLRTVARGDATG